MKATFVIPFLAQGIAAGIVQRQQGSCTNDNCALAVNPLDSRLAQIAREDCSSYLLTTLTVGVTTTTSTFSSTYWTITVPCKTPLPALPKRAYGPYHSANATSTPAVSGTGTGISLGTSASPVTTLLSTTTDISQSHPIPTYATPCGIPYYYSSACACLSIFPNIVYETVPVITSLALEATAVYTTVGCTATETASVPEASSSSEVLSSTSVPTESPSSPSSTSRPNLTIPGPSQTSSASSSSPTGTAPLGTGLSSLASSLSAPFPIDNSTTNSGPTGGPTATAPIITAPVGTGPSFIVSSPSAPFPLDNSTATVGPTGTAPIGTGSSSSIILSTWTVIPPTRGSSSVVASPSPPFPRGNSTTAIAGPTGTAPIGTGFSSIILSTWTVIPPTRGSSSTVASPSPPFPIDNSTKTSGPTEGPTAITSRGTGTGPGVTFSESTSSPPFPMDNNTSLTSGPTGTAPLVTAPIGTGSTPSMPTDVPSASPPYPLSNATSPTGLTAGPTGTASLVIGVTETSLPTPPYPLTNGTAPLGPTGTGSIGTGVLSSPSSAIPPYPLTNETSPLGLTAGPTGTGSIGTGVTAIPSSPSAPFPIDNTTTISGPTGTGSIGTSVPQTSSPPFPMDNSTSFPGPTGTASIGTGMPLSLPTSSPPYPLTNSTSCSDDVGPTATGITLPTPPSTASANITDSISAPTSSMGGTGTGGILVTGTGAPTSPVTETGLFPNSTLGSPVQATRSSVSGIGTGTAPLVTGVAPTISSSTISVGLPSPTNSCTPSVYNTTSAGTHTDYQPNYAADYTGCFLDPDSAQGFILVENGTSTPIVNVNGYAKRMPSTTTSFSGAYFTFEKPSGPLASEQCGVYDLAYHDGDTISYIAIFNDGVVAFVPASSNGQDMTDLTSQYVTSIWSINCPGTLSAGITNNLPYEFSFLQTPNRGTLMVVNWNFDGVLGNGARGASGAGPGMERRSIQGINVGSVSLSLAKKGGAVPGARNGKVGKRGPKPKSDRVLNV